jgi:hypothetical protein
LNLQYCILQCGICRKGGQENFVHCDGCGMCLGKHVIAKHKCRQVSPLCTAAVRSRFFTQCQVCIDAIHALKPGHSEARLPDMSGASVRVCARSFCASDVWARDAHGVFPWVTRHFVQVPDLYKISGRYERSFCAGNFVAVAAALVSDCMPSTFTAHTCAHVSFWAFLR